MKLKNLFTAASCLFIANAIFSQVGIGITNPSPSALLELSSSNKGLLPPRMTKIQRDAIANPETGLLVYCTNCSSSGGGCLSQNNGIPTLPNWECVGSSSVPSLTANCNGFLTGTYVNGSAVSGTYTVTLTNNSFGTATIAFSTADLVLSGVPGISVSAVSPSLVTLNAGGVQVITYTISGTSSNLGTLTGTWTKLTLNCSSTKQVTNPPPVFTCKNTISSNNYTLITNNTYSGTITIPYSATIAGDAYPAQTITLNGLSFTRNAGTYTAPSGTIVYTISGTYTGANYGVFAFSVDAFAGGCSVTIFDAMRNALSLSGCTSCTAYDAAAVDGWINVTAAEYNQVALISGTGKYVADDALMANGSSNTYVGGSTITSSSSTNSKIPASNYVTAMKVRTGPSSPGSMAGMRLKVSTTITGVYTNIGGTTPNASSVSGNSFYYFILKRPTQMTPSSAPSFMGMYQPIAHQLGFITNGSNYSAGGDLGSMGGATFGNFTFLTQVLATPTKQW